MKKALHLGLFVLIVSAPLFASEKNAPQGTIQAFAKNMLNRHTYEFNSWEHKRDRAILCLLPSYISQAILSRQRSNMQKFLKQNEENALEGVRNYFNLDLQQWDDINKTFQKEHTFNLNAMKRTDTSLGHHDENLPQEYIQAVEKEAQRYGINKNNLNLKTSTAISFADTTSIRPSEKYNPTSIKFNSQLISQCPQALPHTTTHEFTHVIHGHYLQRTIIIDVALQRPQLIKEIELFNKELAELEQKNMNLFNKNRSLSIVERLDIFDTFASKRKECLLKQDLLSKKQEFLLAKKNLLETKLNYSEKSKEAYVLLAAYEKTADTYACCENPQAAKNAVISIKSKYNAGFSSYPDNHNDMKVIHSNWERSKAIMDFQNLKSRAQQKIRSLLPIIRS